MYLSVRILKYDYKYNKTSTMQELAFSIVCYFIVTKLNRTGIPRGGRVVHEFRVNELGV